MYKIIILLGFFSFSVFAEDYITYQRDRISTGYITRKLIKEYREIQKHKSYVEKKSHFSTHDRISSMKDLSSNYQNNQQVNIQIPLIWYTERF